MFYNYGYSSGHTQSTERLGDGQIHQIGAKHGGSRCGWASNTLSIPNTPLLYQGTRGTFDGTNDFPPTQLSQKITSIVCVGVLMRQTTKHPKKHICPFGNTSKKKKKNIVRLTIRSKRCLHVCFRFACATVQTKNTKRLTTTHRQRCSNTQRQ